MQKSDFSDRCYKDPHLKPEMTLPNFLIIGAAKSGTTALYHYIKQHPQIYMSPRKEPHFFSYEGKYPNSQGPKDYINEAIIDFNAYKALFDGVSDEPAIGEASPTYIYIPKASKRIKHYIPSVKLIAILRQPAERAFSAFMHLRRDGLEKISDFSKALDAEEWRIQNNWGPIWHYKRCGFYFSQLSIFFDEFEREQIRVYLYEDFKQDPLIVLRDIFRFLNVNSDFLPDTSIRPNVSGIPRSQTVQRFLNSLFTEPNPIKSGARKILPEEIRFKATTTLRNMNLASAETPSLMIARLTKEFSSDIIQLESLIDRDLSQWLQ